MEHTLNILFYTRGKRTSASNTVPIYLRITINGESIEQSISRVIEKDKWSQTSG